MSKIQVSHGYAVTYAASNAANIVQSQLESLARVQYTAQAPIGCARKSSVSSARSEYVDATPPRGDMDYPTVNRI